MYLTPDQFTSMPRITDRQWKRWIVPPCLTPIAFPITVTFWFSSLFALTNLCFRGLLSHGSFLQHNLPVNIANSTCSSILSTAGNAQRPPTNADWLTLLQNQMPNWFHNGDVEHKSWLQNKVHPVVMWMNVYNSCSAFQPNTSVS